MKRDNGSILGPYNTTTTDRASGFWSLNEARYLTAAQKFPAYGQYPVYQLAFNTLSALPANVSFTRASAGSYVDSSGVVQIAAANTARFDYNGYTSVNQGILIEETRTNLCQFSQIFNGTNFRVGSGTITANNATAPDGTTTASTVVGTGTGSDQFDIYPNDYGSNQGANQVFSLYIKPISIVGYRISIGGGYADFNFNTLALSRPGESYIERCANGWYRLSWATTKSNQYHYWGAGAGDGSGAFVNTGTYYIWGLQLENTPVNSIRPSSYIRNGNQNNTRANDVCTMSSANTSWLNTTTGTIILQFDTISKQNNQIALCVDDTTTQNTIKLIVTNSSPELTSTANLYYEVTTNGALQGTNLPTPTIGTALTLSSNNKLGLALQQDYLGASRNGGAVTTDTSAITPTTNTVRFGRDFNGGKYLSGHISSFQYYNSRLNDATLITKTT